MSKENITVRGAEEHNLKDVDVEIPREAFTVVTGLSGSGKSSLAFDTIYAEGQRRYIESLSAYARNFLGQMDKPKVEAVEGLSPAISIDQKNAANNPRSTVGTVTELHDYLRLLYARIGTQYDPITGEEVGEQSAQEMVRQLLAFPEGTRAKIAAPVVRDQKGAFEDLFDELVADGYSRVEVDGEAFDLTIEKPDLDKNYDHTIDVIVDRVKLSTDARSRITDSVETALEEADSVLKVIVPDPPENPPLGSNTRSTGDLAGEGDDRLVVELSEALGNPNSDFQFSEIETRSFSFNSPHGACPECEGIGQAKEVDKDLIIQDPTKPLKDVFEAWSYNRSYYRTRIDSVAAHFGVSVETPWEEIDSDIQRQFLYGTDKQVVFERTTRNGTRRKQKRFEGVIPNLDRRHVETDSKVPESTSRSIWPSPNVRPVRERGSKNNHGTSSWVGHRSPQSTSSLLAMRVDISKASKNNSPSANALLPPRFSKRSARGWVSWKKSASNTSHSTGRQPRCRAARANAFDWQPRSARDSSVCSTSLMSRRLGSISVITTDC